MTDLNGQIGRSAGFALADQVGALPDAPLAMPKQRIETTPWTVARLFKGLAALPRLLADDRGH